MSMMAMMQAVAGTQVAGLGDPRAVSLDGVDQSIDIDGLFTGRETSGRADDFSWGISANMASVTGVRPVVDSSSAGAFRSGGAIAVLSGVIIYSASVGTTNRRSDTAAASVSAGVTFRAAATWDTDTNTLDPYLNGAASGGPNGNVNGAYATPDVTIGRNGTGSYQEGEFWAFWWTPVTMTSVQIAALDALIVAEDYAGARDYLLALSGDSVFIAVLDTDDLTGGTGSVEDVCGNIDGVPINTVPADLVSIP